MHHSETITKLSQIVSLSTGEHEVMRIIFVANNVLRNSISIKIFIPINYLKNESNFLILMMVFQLLKFALLKLWVSQK